MGNYTCALAYLRWKAGKILPGHQFKIYDIAVHEDSGKIVLLTGIYRAGGKYYYIELDDLETGIAPRENFRKAKSEEITEEHEILKGKLIRIQGYQGEAHWRQLQEMMEPKWTEDSTPQE